MLDCVFPNVAGFHHRVQSSLGSTPSETRVCRKHLLPLQGNAVWVPTGKSQRCRVMVYSVYMSELLERGVENGIDHVFPSTGHRRPLLPQGGPVHSGKTQRPCQGTLWVCSCAGRPHRGPRGQVGDRSESYGLKPPVISTDSMVLFEQESSNYNTCDFKHSLSL